MALKKIKIIFWMFVFLSLAIIPIVSGEDISCQYDDTPYIRSELPLLENKITWFCNSTMINYKCISYIEHSGELLQTNPNGKNLFGIGIIDKFDSDGSFITVYFLPEMNIILGSETYQFGIYCGDGTSLMNYERNITPVYYDSAIKMVDNLEWLYNNWGLIIPIIILIVLIVVTCIILFRR